jgi:transposase
MSNDQKKTGATPRKYDEAFKQEAIRLWQSSGQAAEHTARQLGISVFHLYEWRKRVARSTRAAGATGLPESKEGLQQEIVRLREENSRLAEQRDILKKSLGILSEPPRSGMPRSRP